MKHLNPFRSVPVRAGRSLETIPARPQPLFLSLVRPLTGAYLRAVQGVRLLAVHGEERLSQTVASSGVYPFIVFRHPSPDDPIVIYHIVSRALRRTRRSISRGGYPVFLYGRDVPIWGGPAVAWALPRGGAISVFHDAINRESMAEVYAAIRVQENPMVLAPEGQITYRNYRCAPIQRGVAALAVDAADSRAEAAASGVGHASSVVVLPAALEYRYPDPRWRRASLVMDRVLRRLGIDGTIRPDRRTLAAALAERPMEWLAAAWEAYTETLLAIHRREAPRLAARIAAEQGGSPPPDRAGAASGASRLRRLCAAATYRETNSSDVPREDPRWTKLQQDVNLLLELSLRRAEISFHLERLPDPLDRLFRIRQRYWERLYPLDRGSPGSLTRGVSDAAATEALLLSRHMQSADVLVYADFSYLRPLTTASPEPAGALHARFVEYLLMLDDLLQRAVGYTVGERYAWPHRNCLVRIGEPIPVAPGTDDGPSRRGRTRDLHRRIEEVLSDLSREER